MLGLVVVVVVATVVAVATGPWVVDEAVPSKPPAPVTDAMTATASVTEPTVAPTVTSPQFDATTIGGLFLTPAVLTGTVPDAVPGVEQVVASGERVWGLPSTSVVEPPECLVARTVVTAQPVAFDARAWQNSAVVVEQQVTLLPDADAAEAAFRALVTAVDACPEYSVVDTAADREEFQAAPATEAQGRYPSLWLEVEHRTSGRLELQLHGHLLVGNVIVTWTVGALGDEVLAREGLGAGNDLDTMIQQQAAKAVDALP